MVMEVCAKNTRVAKKYSLLEKLPYSWFSVKQMMQFITFWHPRSEKNKLTAEFTYFRSLPWDLS